MPAIVLPHTFADGAPADPDELMENLYAPNATTPDSLDVVNGQLDEDNLDAGVTVRYDHVQPYAKFGVWQAGSNVAIDYFWQATTTVLSLSGGSTGDSADDTGDFTPVPGVNLAFYLKTVPRYLWVSWNIAWITDAIADPFVDATYVGTPYVAAMRYALDGTFFNEQRRVARASVDFNPAPKEFHGKMAASWSGHRLHESPSAGWHNAGLYIATNTVQARVRARAIRAIAFW